MTTVECGTQPGLGCSYVADRDPPNVLAARDGGSSSRTSGGSSASRSGALLACVAAPAAGIGSTGTGPRTERPLSPQPRIDVSEVRPRGHSRVHSVYSTAARRLTSASVRDPGSAGGSTLASRLCSLASRPVSRESSESYGQSLSVSQSQPIRHVRPFSGVLVSSPVFWAYWGG